MNWKLKWATDTLKAALPLKDQLRALKRRITPYDTDPTIDEFTFVQGLDQICLIGEAGCNLEGKSALEVGTGWLPLIPLLFRVAGASQITLADIERLMDAHTFHNACRFLLDRAPAIAQRLGMDEELVRSRLTFPDGLDLTELLQHASMRYAVPFDPAQEPEGSIDVASSRAVLEHIRPATIEALFRGFTRLLKPDGIMCHIIDNSDHWEHDDKSISRVNFLKFGDTTMWALGLHVQNYQNRLRHYEYLELLEKTGYEVTLQRGEVDEASLQALRHLPLCKRYRDRNPAELAILNSYIVARKSQATPNDPAPAG